ncbi:Flp pilus assembly complex ATPase component TadA [Salmonella enterica]|nr:pilus assembly protein PilQ [Salmonella enterica]EBL9827222.1 pilus assembly protein PilQ [Salmonella enterica]EDS3252661.1 pilus assembly protein PilQ [Salmonella enterica]EHO0905846.1 Flp pilus assembly complex ATPase component TadA [Salmonella enterica]EHQ9759787.1 Flp pilus assembly complex ATPase component TadA [Salmonella enterica]
MNYSERTHSLVNISKHLPGIKIPNEIVDNVRLLKNNEGDDYQLIVMDKLDNDPLYFDFKTQLIKKSIRPIVKWVGREELAEISSAFDISVSSSSDSQSDAQNKVISIIKHAVDQRASDIHFRIDTTYFQVAFRVDGIKRNIKKFEDSAENGRQLVNALFNSMCTEQSTSTLSSTEASDARIKEEFVSEFGLSTGRFASRPGNSGTLLAVVRLISKRKQQLELEHLGLTQKQASAIRRTLSKPSGAIFSSGPTGHGKSTLSQCMAESVTRDDSGINLLTVEDPIESPIRGAVQTPLILADRSDRELMGKAWGKAISNLMRLDPDFIYIGEVRDSTSATGVIEAAQTGHNVITTIHTSHPIDIIQRLRRFGVDQDLLTDATLITCLIGLRLTPLLCPNCKRPYDSYKSEIEHELQELIEKHTDSHNAYLINESGCEQCEGTGIKGRTGVFEVIETDYTFMSLYEREGKFAAWKYWRSKGGETLCENITLLINQGKVDPVIAHKKICNLDRDEKFNE